jgi:hypothetical protein
LLLHCSHPIIINEIKVSTPGFSIVSFNTTLPFQLDSNASMQIVVKAPGGPFAGNLEILLNSTAQPSDNFSIPIVHILRSEKTVLGFYVSNDGLTIINLTRVFLVDSNGSVVNQTALFTRQWPSTLQFYDMNISYPNATLSAYYHLTVESATGVSASSDPFILWCTCAG